MRTFFVIRSPHGAYALHAFPIVVQRLHQRNWTDLSNEAHYFDTRAQAQAWVTSWKKLRGTCDVDIQTVTT